jgi:hypothetical protein
MAFRGDCGKRNKIFRVGNWRFTIYDLRVNGGDRVNRKSQIANE